MKVLIVGGGGKEHAIVWKLSRSRHVRKIYCCPGNAGIAEVAECIDVSPHNFDALLDFVKYDWVDLTIVGDEESLSEGIVDAFEKEGRRIVGPKRAATELGLSRVFAKDLMRLHRIPTAEYRVFTSYLHAEDYVRLKGTPLTVKADRPAEGDGTFVALTMEEAMDALRLLMKERVFGSTGRGVVIEEWLKGEEASFMVFTDGRTIMPATGLKNYRRIFNGDTGPDTKGIGACSPAPAITNELEASIMRKIMRPLLKALNSEGIKYKGILSADLMIDEGRPYVLEFNHAFGDPETQTVLPRLKTDLAEIVLAIIEERLSGMKIEWEEKASVCVVASSGGYPGRYEKGATIAGLEEVKKMKDVSVFHIGTSLSGDDTVTSGGRVISVVATGADIKDARAKAYKALEEIHFDGMHYRTDIGLPGKEKTQKIR